MADSIASATPRTGLGVGPDYLPATADAFIPSADYKATDPTAVEFPTTGGVALALLLNVTAQSGAGNTITVNVDIFDPISATWIPVATTFTYATGAAGTKVFYLDPRQTAVANQTVQGVLGARMRVRPVGSGTRTTLNYSIGAVLAR